MNLSFSPGSYRSFPHYFLFESHVFLTQYILSGYVACIFIWMERGSRRKIHSFLTIPGIVSLFSPWMWRWQERPSHGGVCCYRKRYLESCTSSSGHCSHDQPRLTGPTPLPVYNSEAVLQTVCAYFSHSRVGVCYAMLEAHTVFSFLLYQETGIFAPGSNVSF